MDAGWKVRSGASRRTDGNGRAGVHRYHRNFRQFLRGKPSRLERSRAAKLGSDHLNRCPVSFCSPPWSFSTNHVSTYRLLAICTRTDAWTRGPPSPDLWIHRITWNSRVCWEAGRPVSDSSNAASALLWCEFNLLFRLYYYFILLKVVKATGKSFGKFVRIVENFYQRVGLCFVCRGNFERFFF